jgi:hypothetical protein
VNQGKFAEALAAFRKVQEVAPPDHPGYEKAKAQIKTCQQLLTLDDKLSAILRGGPKPASAAGLLDLADLCQRCKKSYAHAARFYQGAFALESKLADDLRTQHRYNAACAAALAVAGKGEDADKLDHKERVRLRKEALEWLRADLDAYTRLGENADAAQAVRERLIHWLQDTDLGALRDEKALSALPQAERQEWQNLWADVSALLKKVEGK